MTAATPKMRCSALKTKRSQALSCCWAIFHGEGPVGSMAPIREKSLCSWHSSPFPFCSYGSRNLKAWYLIVQSLPGSHPHHSPPLSTVFSPTSPSSYIECLWVVVIAEHSCVPVTMLALQVLQGWGVHFVLVNPPHLHMPQTSEPPYDVRQTDHGDSSSHPDFFLSFLVAPEQSTEDRIYLLDQRT